MWYKRKRTRAEDLLFDLVNKYREITRCPAGESLKAHLKGLMKRVDDLEYERDDLESEVRRMESEMEDSPC